MNERSPALSAFHLTGQIAGEETFEITGRGLRPALFSSYGDLARLRHDFPMVLTRRVNGGASLASLSDIMTELVVRIAPRGSAGEQRRQHVLRLEAEIRQLAAAGRRAELGELWQEAASNLRARAGDDNERSALDGSLEAARAALEVDGDVVGYSGEAAQAMVGHAWAAVEADRARRGAAVIDGLTLELSNILKADAMRSPGAFDADTLKQAVGSSWQTAFDFEAMSDILGTSYVDGALPERRRQRIRAVLTTLNRRATMPGPAGDGDDRGKAAGRGLVFESCGAALEAHRRRLPRIVDLAKAMTIARLEIDGSYREAIHDEFFRRYDARYLGEDDLDLFPSYLVCLRGGRDVGPDMAALMQTLSSGLPIKVLILNDDILEGLAPVAGRFGPGEAAFRLASMALGLDGVFVVQASGADLYRLNGSLVDGLQHPGPAVFSIYSGGPAAPATGAARNVGEPAHYLRAAAATEARAFPAFVLDPGAGEDWRARFSLRANPQPERDWPVHRFAYEDEALRRISEDVAFTLVDFAAIDGRYGAHFAGVPRAHWHAAMVPLDRFMLLDGDEAVGKVPYILMVDEDNALHRVIVETGLIEAARRCRRSWRGLRELGGIDNSHVNAALAAEPSRREQDQEREPAAESAGPAAGPAIASAPEPAAAAEAATEPADAGEAAPASGEPYIETARCTTCEECVRINDRMFAYDANKQAYIADPRAGTYRQLVEAAESCQVAIIHPGKPLNPGEPGLDELIERADAFNEPRLLTPAREVREA